MTGMDEAQKELSAMDAEVGGRLGRLAGISNQLEKLQDEIHALRADLKDNSSA
jgi:archaellum component FlaC